MGLSGSPSKRDAYDRGGGEGEGGGAQEPCIQGLLNVLVFLRTSLFLDTFWGTFSRKIELHHVYERIRNRNQKGKLNVIKITYRPKNEIFCLLKKVCRFC